MEKSVKITKIIDASRELLFDAWINSAEFSKWFLPASGVLIDAVEMDAVAGGKFKIMMKAGANEMPHTGEFKIIDRPNKLEFSWYSFNTPEQGSLVTVLFEEVETKTLITLEHQELASDSSKKDHLAGWQSILGHLEVFIKRKKTA